MILTRKGILKQGFCVGVVALLVCIGFSSAIQFRAVTAAQDDRMVTLTTKACGIPGLGTTTAMLTAAQYQDLTAYLATVLAELNQSTTQAEMLQVYQSALQRLASLHLLPGGSDGQQIIGAIRRNIQLRWPLSALPPKITTPLMDNSNLFCLVAGTASEVFYPPRLYLLFSGIVNHSTWLFDLEARLSGQNLTHRPFLALLYKLVLAYDLALGFTLLFSIVPLGLTNLVPVSYRFGITFGGKGYWDYGSEVFPSHVVGVSLGLHGFQRYSGAYYGSLGKVIFPVIYMFPGDYTGAEGYLGALGFVGIHFYMEPKNQDFFLGSARVISLST